MKRLFLIFLPIILNVNLFAQKNKYPSKEEDRYYKEFDFKYVPFKPLDTVFILSFKSDYFEICETESNFEPFLLEKYSSPHTKYLQNYIDSLRSALPRKDFFKQAQEEMERDNGKIGEIDKREILKYEKRDSIEAFIYESRKYENRWFGEPGIWIGYSENNGKDWNYYYTGIVQKQPIFIKYYSQRPLIKEKGKLEIDACLLRQLSAFSHPGPSPEYECVKDGIFIVFDIEIVAKDSDNDGLTDIVEDKFYTDKYNRDTNGNGISDNRDSNPRVNYPRTQKSKIYEATIDHEIDWNYKKGGGKLVCKEEVVYVSDSTETILIVTDNEDLMGIRSSKFRIIFLTNEEYRQKADGFNTQLNRMHISPLFKVDNRKNAYKLKESFNTGDVTSLIRKTKEGWVIIIISAWVS